MQVLTTTRYRFHLPKIYDGTIQGWWAWSEMGTFKHRKWVWSLWRTSEQFRQVPLGWSQTYSWKYVLRRIEVNTKTRKWEQCLSESVQKNGPMRCLGAKRLCGHISLARIHPIAPSWRFPRPVGIPKPLKRPVVKKFLNFGQHTSLEI